MDAATVKHLNNQFRRLGMEAKDLADSGDYIAAIQRLGMMDGINLAIESAAGRCMVRVAMLKVVAHYLA